jgi:predicted nucleic acid-binding protein
MPDSAFFDTNVLIYVFSEGDRRQDAALKLLLDGGSVGVQTLNEFASIATGKLKLPWSETVARLDIVRRLCPRVIPMTLDVHERGIHISQSTGYRFYDSLMLAAAIEGDCRIFYSEDLHDGQAVERLRIRNPFKLS